MLMRVRRAAGTGPEDVISDRQVKAGDAVFVKDDLLFPEHARYEHPKHREQKRAGALSVLDRLGLAFGHPDGDIKQAAFVGSLTKLGQELNLSRHHPCGVSMHDHGNTVALPQELLHKPSGGVETARKEHHSVRVDHLRLSVAEA